MTKKQATTPEKLTMRTADMVEKNIAAIGEIFPNCVTEGRDDNGNPCQKINFDLLRQELSTSLVEGSAERYQLDWPGKRQALLTANSPITKTLRPRCNESVNFDTTKNLFIEGDNLDALKLLQATYGGKVKMIYIDPPYNTGNDFIYNDNFNTDKQEYLANSEQIDDNGDKLVANTESNGRFHSDWLSMLYPRLKLARNLLRDDGVIFVSIDERESANVRKVLDEVFGESNLIGEFMVIKSEGGGLAKQMIKGHDSLFAFSKDIQRFQPLLRPKDIRGKIVKMHDEDYWIEEDWLRKEFGKYGTCLYDEIATCLGPAKKEEIDEGLREGRYVLLDKGKGKIVGRYRRVNGDGSKFYSVLKHLNRYGAESLQELSLGGVFDYPKPVSLLREIILGCTLFAGDSDAIILDFFAGSATTAHAVMQLNAEDGGNRRFILVQLPEKCADDSEAAKAGFGTIAEIGKERIRCAGAKVLDGSCHEAWGRDVGFRVLKVDSSNLRDVYYVPDELRQSDIVDLVSNVKDGRTEEDLIFQVMLDLGLDLSLSVVVDEAGFGRAVFVVGSGELVGYFGEGLDAVFVKKLAKLKPQRVVFRDASFATDAEKVNAVHLFKQLSPATEVRVV